MDHLDDAFTFHPPGRSALAEREVLQPATPLSSGPLVGDLDPKPLPPGLGPPLGGSLVRVCRV